MIKLLIAALAGAAIVFILTVLIFGLIGAYRENEKLKEELEGKVFARTSNGSLIVTPDDEGLHIIADLGRHAKSEKAEKARGFADIPLHEIKNYCDAYGGSLGDFKMIVRCNNCIHHRYDDESETFTCTLRSGAVVKADGFCSDAERILK